MAGIRITVLLILDPEVCIGHVAVKNVLTVFRVRFQIGRLDLFADKFGVFRDQIAFQVLQVFLCQILRELLTFDLLLQHIEQVNRVRGDLCVIKVEHPRQNFKREAGGQAVHAFIDPGVVAVFLVRLGFRIGILQAFAVVDAHLRVDAGVFRFFHA
ncbi:hypothetical protein D3C72_1751070 [compost metagenome]